MVPCRPLLRDDHGPCAGTAEFHLVSQQHIRRRRDVGRCAMAVTLLAGQTCGLATVPTGEDGKFFGLDFFVLNMILTGLLSIPRERMFAHNRDHSLIRAERHEDLSTIS
jgi:hypothetical protein